MELLAASVLLGCAFSFFGWFIVKCFVLLFGLSLSRQAHPP
jgi:hypothetical protein